VYNVSQPRLTDIFDANRDIRDRAILLSSLRRVAPFLAYVAIRTRISPFHINFFNFLLGLTICGLFALAPPELRIMAASLLIAWQMLDATDGTMARALGIRSNYGGFIDLLGGMFLIAFLHVSIGVGLFRFPEYSLQEFFGMLGLHANYVPAYSVVVGAYCSIAAILFRLTSRIIQVRFGIDLNKATSGADGAGKLPPASSFVNVARNIEGIGGIQFIILLIAAIFETLEIFLVLYLVINFAVLLGFTAKAFIRLRHRHDYR
jgi:hypothetical protein